MNAEVLVSSQIDKETMLQVIVYGNANPSVKALDKLIELLVAARNDLSWELQDTASSGEKK